MTTYIFIRAPLDSKCVYESLLENDVECLSSIDVVVYIVRVNDRKIFLTTSSPVFTFSVECTKSPKTSYSTTILLSTKECKL